MRRDVRLRGPAIDTHRSGSTRSAGWLLPVSALVAVLLAGCSGDGGNLPPPTRTDLPSVSVSVPSRSPSAEAPETATPTPEPSEAPTETPEPPPTATPPPQPPPPPPPPKSGLA